MASPDTIVTAALPSSSSRRDDIARLVDDAIGPPRDLGDLQRLQTLEDLELQHGSHKEIDSHDRHML